MKRKILILLSLLVMVTLLSGMVQPPLIVNAATPAPGRDSKDHWKLEDIYPSLDAWEKDFKEVKEKNLPRYQEYEGKLGDAAHFLDLMQFDEQTSRSMDKLYVYATMKRDENNADSQASEMASRAEALYNNLTAAGAFVRPELIALPDDSLQTYLKDDSLKQYTLFLQYILDQKAHTLSSAEETILAQAEHIAGAPETISTKIREADLQFPKIRDPRGQPVLLSEANYGDLLLNPDRSFREQVYKNMLNTYGSMKNSLAAALDAQMRKDTFFATARKYDSSLDAALAENHIPRTVYQNLLETTHQDINVLHQYITLRKKILGLNKVRPYDLFVPLVSGYTPKEYSYEETQALMAEALKPLGNTYVHDMQAGFNDGWIDVYPAENKTSGAYSLAAYDTHPYILTNYTRSLDSLLTVAHEMGHAMNYFYTNKAQPYINSNTPVFNAEVASATHELLVLHYLIDHATSDQEQLYYLDRLAETIRGTFFAQVMYAEFESQIHDSVEKGEALSVDRLNQMWGDTLNRFYGPDFELIDEAKLGWARIPHFYSHFYVYQYATGIAAANQFSTRLTANTPGVNSEYQAFLEAGASDYPVNVLKNAGVDMNTSEAVNILLTDFNNTVNRMETILVKMGKLKK